MENLDTQTLRSMTSPSTMYSSAFKSSGINIWRPIVVLTLLVKTNSRLGDQDSYVGYPSDARVTHLIPT